MLELRVNNQPIDLFPGTKVPLQFYSPIFDRDSIQRSFSFPFKIPATQRNKKLLEYPSRIDGTGRRIYEKSELRLAGHQFEQGVLVLLSSTAKEFEIAFKNETLQLLDNLNSYRLRENISMNVEAVEEIAVDVLLSVGYNPSLLGNKTILNINGNDYVRTLAERDQMVDDINADFPGLCTIVLSTINDFFISFNTQVKPDLNIQIKPEIPAEHVGDVFLYFTVNLLPSDSYQEIIDGYATHLDQVIAGTIDTHAFPVIHAPNFYDKDNEAWKGYVNYYDEAGEYPLTLRTIAEKSEYNLVPMPFLKAAFEEIFRTAGGLAVTGSFFSDSDLAKLIIYNNNSLEVDISETNYIEDIEVITNIENYIYLSFKQSYNLADHLPDLSYYEFVTKVASMFPLVYQVNAGTIKIDTVQALLSKSSIDLSSYVLEDWKKKNTKYSDYDLSYTRYNTPEENEAYLQDLRSEENGLEAIKIKSEFFTHYFRRIIDLNTADEAGENARRWVVPTDPFVGSTIANDVGASADLRLLFYYGLQPDSKGQNYPFASFLPENLNSESLGPYSLEWDGPKGLYQQHWKEYIELLMSDELTMQFLLPMQKIIELKQNITTAIYVSHPDGAFRGLIKKFSFSASITSTNQFLCSMTIAKQ